jgi:hypothetical protein
VAVHFMHYNFGRIPQTLRVTPAMEAGVTDHVWSIEEIVALLDQPPASAQTRDGMKAQVKSVLTCPLCGRQTEEQMPESACVYFFDCPFCGERLRPHPGDCCVFCSFGTVPCPPKQQPSPN